ncbi:MAG TPA: VIT domain-containing protein, partial [Thermoplasmata archaeon]|nr:VIT domain-containing protein [Thermoplasmata archaeon]
MLALLVVMAALLPAAQAFCSVVETELKPPVATEAGVEIELSEGYAVTRIQKVFYNPENIDQRGKLIFPVHQNRFFITALSWTDGKEVLLGKMADKEAARDAFEKAVG